VGLFSFSTAVEKAVENPPPGGGILFLQSKVRSDGFLAARPLGY
jgi:hypothetical protein